ncbi:MAG TPA: HAMP domain-containing sensor histidine kinase [Chloroflexota bacterium]|nr:HAMP domain-containing sensor histidine kinase [Chloroflexota bacterium]
MTASGAPAGSPASVGSLAQLVRFHSLRGRLLAGFVLVTLFTAGSAIVWIVQDYQRSLAIDRLGEVAAAAAFVGRQLETRDARPDEISSLIAGQLLPAKVGNVRVLIVDAQRRVASEHPEPSGPLEPSFAGREIDTPSEPGARRQLGQPGREALPRGRATAWTDSTAFPGRPYTFISAPPPPDRFSARPAQYRVVLAVPERDLGAAWRELIPSLAFAALVAVGVAAIAAVWLARSITRPLRQITNAAQAIARGDLRQTIPVRGRDEVAQLAVSFNSMSLEVERSHRALREFLANASHELRTPLTSIQGFSQALVDGAVGPDGAADAGQIINDEADRMRRLVEDLLYLSRVEAQEVSERREAVDVALLIREASRRLQLVAEQRELDVDVQLGTLPAATGDPDQLDRVFGNLLDNAGKYTPPGGKISLRSESTPGVVRVTVHNTGAGIPVEDLTHVFDRFYRVDKSRSRDVEGSGLGLAIAREVVERHGGTIDVTSSVEAGTAFTVTLPAARAAPGDVSGAEDRPPPRAAAQPAI